MYVFQGETMQITAKGKHRQAWNDEICGNFMWFWVFSASKNGKL
jgi:hypothetical protein